MEVWLPHINYQVWLSHIKLNSDDITTPCFFVRMTIPLTEKLMLKELMR